MPKETRAALITLSLTALVFVLPMLLGSGGADLSWRLLWQEGFSRQFWEGALYPRWLPEMVAGCGSPLFFLYPPLSFFLTALFYPLAAIPPGGWFSWMPMAFLVALLGGWWCYRWLRTFLSHPAALAAAAIYVVSPYHLLEHYLMLNPSEMLGAALLPLVLLLIERLRQGGARPGLLLSAAMALLLLSNQPLVLVTLLVAVPYALFRMPREGRGRFLLSGLAAGLFALLLSAAFLLPMAALMPHIAMFQDGSFWEGRYAAHQNLFFMKGATPLVAAYLVLFLVGLYVWALFLFGLWRARPARWAGLLKRQLSFWLLVAASVTLLMMPLAAPLWQHVPLLSGISFAPRILRLSDLSLVVLLGLLLETRWLATRPGSASTVLWIGAAYVAILTAAIIAPSRFDVRDPHQRVTPNAEALAEKFKHRIEVTHSYLPVWVTQHRDISRMPTLEKQNQYGLSPAFVKECAVRVKTLAGKGSAKVTGWEARHIELAITGSPTRLRVAQFYFPGWRAADQDGKALELRPTKELGLIEIALPKGTKHVTLRLEKLKSELIGNWISSIGWVIWGLLFLRTRKRTPAHA